MTTTLESLVRIPRVSGLATGLALAAALVLSQGASGQENRKETLADIRQELEFMNVEILFLQGQLLTTGGVRSARRDEPLVLRLDALEAETRRLTGIVEDLQFRVETIVRDGKRRIGDLEYRLVELEGGDVSHLGETTTLGTPDPAPANPEDAGAGIAVSEEDAFDRALDAFRDGDHRTALGRFAVFLEAHPTSPRSAEARYWQGESFAALAEWREAAKAYLDSFSAAPQGQLTPHALQKLGTSLARLGQVSEACIALGEVSVRYPDAREAVDAANAAKLDIGCD